MTIQKDKYELDDNLFVKRLFKIPVMASALDQFNILYQTTKERNSLFRYSLNSAEKGFNLAVGAAKPVVGKFENQINYLNDVACTKLDKAEEKYPIISKSTEELVESARKTCESLVEPLKNQITAAKDYGCVKMNNMKGSAIESVNSVVNYGLEKSSKLFEVMPGSQYVIKNAGYSLTLADQYVNIFMPEEADDKDEMDVHVNDDYTGEYLFKKALNVSDKLRRRIGRKVLKNLNEIQIKSSEKKNFTVEKICDAKDLAIGKLVGAKDYAIGSVVCARDYTYDSISKTSSAGITAAKNGGSWMVRKIGDNPLCKKTLESIGQGLDYTVWYLDEITGDKEDVNIELLKNSTELKDKVYYVAYKFKHRINVGVQSLLEQAGDKKNELKQFSTYYVLYPIKKAEETKDKLKMIIDASFITEQDIDEDKDINNAANKFSDFDKAIISTSRQLIFSSKKFYNAATYVPKSVVDSIFDSAKKNLSLTNIETQIKKVFSIPIIESNVIIPVNNFLKTSPLILGYLLDTPNRALTYINDLETIKLTNIVSTKTGQFVSYVISTSEKIITLIVSARGNLLAYLFSSKEDGKKKD